MISTARHITLWSEQEIRHTLKNARSIWRSEYANFSAIPTQREQGRILIIISRKVGSAVVRNRIRRRIRALFYEKKLFEGGFDWVLFFKPAAANTSFAELEAFITTCVQRLGANGLSRRSKSADHSSEQPAAVDSPPAAPITRS